MEFLKKVALAITIATTLTATSQNDKIAKAFEESYTLEQSGNSKKSIEILKAVYNESSYEINLRLGWLHYSSGLFTESVSYYQKTIMLMPVSIEAKLGLVLPYSALGNWNAVEKVYLDILKLDNANYTANYKLGLIYYGRENYTSAFNNFQKVANNYPFDYSSLLMFAWTNFKLGKTREAKILFEKVLLNTPNDASAKEGLSYIK
jgi:tetratricopeptide (TPR) repeat protein